jgi:hypothetical protein
MALESWNGLRLGLMALGYSKVIWTHLHCVTHGVFKLGISDEMDTYPCPECGVACKVNFIAQGFTRYELPAPEKICKPLSARTRQELLAEPRIVKPRRIPDRHAAKLRRGISEHQPACDARPRASIVRSWAMPDR